jgi:hypothetical protein
MPRCRREKPFLSATLLNRLVAGDRRFSAGLLLAEMYLRILISL